MQNSDFSPLTVVPYSKDYLVDFVRLKTGWDQRSEVSGKAQLNYLCSYLEVDHIDAKTIVVENEYVDRHYLEDYSEYYARCFPTHPRMCSRIHFFSAEFTELQFSTGLAQNDAEFLRLISNTYVGFVVFRPIPHTFIAKLCIRPYGALANDLAYRIIQRENHVSLFGVKLKVSATQFVEQDKVIAACATSALWVLFGASNEQHPEKMPSPSAITKAATKNNTDGSRTFPTRGLTESQMAVSLKHFGLEPQWFNCNDDGAFCDLKEAIYAYVTNGTPMLLGGMVYEIEGEIAKELGNHLVCALGYHVGKSAKQSDDIKMLSHQIDKLYVHDDRYGPYLRLDVSEVRAHKDESGKSVAGFYISLYEREHQLFVPNIALAGLDHKARITYEHVRNACAALHYYVNYSAGLLGSAVNVGALGADETAYVAEILEALQIASNGYWEITLTTNRRIKEDLLKSNEFRAFNGAPNKNALLLKNLPKHIWRCRILTEMDLSNGPYFDILFDATEIPQGRIVIGYLSYALPAEAMWKNIEVSISDREWQEFPIFGKARTYVGAFFKFFNERSERSYLNSVYGQLQLPRRPLKLGETDDFENISKRNDVLTVRRGDSSKSWRLLDPAIKYIWVVNEGGDLVVGEDIAGDDGYRGHPTLIDGRPGRLGGELSTLDMANKWQVNLRSRAYPAPWPPDSDDYNTLLQNVISHNFGGLDVIAAGQQAL